MKNIFGAMFIVLVLIGAGCGNASPNPPGTSDTSVVDSGRSTALTFHIETAANDLRNAVSNTTGDTLEHLAGTVSYMQMTLPVAIEIANDDGATDDAAKLTELDARLTEATTNSATIDDLVAEVLAVADELDAM